MYNQIIEKIKEKNFTEKQAKSIMIRFVMFGIYIAVPINFIVARLIGQFIMPIITLIIIAIITTRMSIKYASKLTENPEKMFKIAKILGNITIVLILILIVMLILFYINFFKLFIC